jgi:HSP20 family molecular chaperone IbpA
MTGTTVSKWLPAGLAPGAVSDVAAVDAVQPGADRRAHDDKHYTLRAEVPGVDPAKDVTVT